jgi:hypothetical protein
MGDPNNTAAWHAFQHPLRTDAAAPWKGPSEPRSDDKPAVSVVRGPHDPVLRQALIDKGVLTPDDLRNAEAKIAVVTGEFHEAVRSAMKEEQS